MNTVTSDPTSIIGNMQALVALVVILVAGLVAVSHLARHKFLGIVIVVVGAALVYLALKGTLIPTVAGWFQQIGL